MGFDVPASAYDAFMGRYSTPLATKFADLVDMRVGESALDVGCGPGALTGELVKRLGPDAVAAVDPSASFLAAVRSRWPGLDVRQATAESLPFPDRTFDHCLAQLVVHFMADPVAGFTEMARVTADGGTVAACAWDFAGDRSPLAVFRRASRELGATAPDESDAPGAGEGELPEFLRQAGLVDVESSELTIRVECESFEDWWEPFTFGVGPAGAYLRTLDAHQAESLKQRCEELLPAGRFTVEASAWAAVGRVRIGHGQRSR